MNFWHTIPRPIVGLSPMDGITDASFRYITAKHGGPDVTLTEFVNIQSAFYSPHTMLKDFLYSEIERPIAAQVYGKSPELFYCVAHIVCELGFDGLDINMGCPAKNVAASGCGAALIRAPGLAREIIRAAKRGVADWSAGSMLEKLGLAGETMRRIRSFNLGRSGAKFPPERRPIPVSIKTRLGYDRVVVEDWLGVLLDEGPAAITLHGRTLEQGYRGQADWDAIGRAALLARGSGTLILGNGDLRGLGDAYRRIRDTDVDGVLIGRGAQGYPWLFRDKEAVKRALRSGNALELAENAVSLVDRFRVVREHSEHFEEMFGEDRFMAMRKHLTWYCRDFRGAAEMRANMVRARNAREVHGYLSGYLAARPARGEMPSFSGAGEVSPPANSASIRL